MTQGIVSLASDQCHLVSACVVFVTSIS